MADLFSAKKMIFTSGSTRICWGRYVSGDQNSKMLPIVPENANVHTPSYFDWEGVGAGEIETFNGEVFAPCTLPPLEPPLSIRLAVGFYHVLPLFLNDI
jgi:hypothetical protein